jgi:hypothetical protein
MKAITELLSFIPNKDLEAFAIDTQVNKHTKKLHGQLLFNTDYTNYIVQSRLRHIAPLICYTGINHCKIIK